LPEFLSELQPFNVMIRLERYTSFDELKSANNTAKNSDMKAFVEYKELIEVLSRSIAVKKAMRTKAAKNKREN